MEESSSTGDQRDKSTEEEVIIREVDTGQPSTCPENELDDRELDGSESKPPLNKSDILKAVEVVERDSQAIADSFSSLFASLRLALSEVTSGSVDHMRCFGDATGRLQESALDAATKGNRYINSCLRLNEEMKGMESLATQLYPYQLPCPALPLHF
ncbi:Pentatricopeptide repeat-containing, mitochondrial -like protein [Gossypium arboreum]|uniref:Pentatricopeptide repeat-containing, mitochondrial-like protein n=1 Tax=Gossypium arboreum TaxID=29729 RepID=A0A0B0PF36_GOSAR|nr:Pentatricopeptide repeat-containing, mitochondrial -like protein [Gossypium arboreum]